MMRLKKIEKLFLLALTMIFKKLWPLFVIIFVIVYLIISFSTVPKIKPNTGIGSKSATTTVTPFPVLVEKYNPIAKYGQEKVDAANKVMNLVKQDCNVFVDGGLVVEMKYYKATKMISSDMSLR